MNKLIGWNHPVDNSDQWDGFNEAGIEHFSGSPIKHLAREVNQNSLDSGNGQVVRVSITRKTVKTDQIPNIDELRSTVALCVSAAKNESVKAQNFFERATNELSKNKIPILQIGDSNTNGMSGPSQNGTPFYAFMKAKGQSKKESDTATGSFGIGKFAPYSVSKLRTVFVSTVYKGPNGEIERLTQGKSILMSHDEKEVRRQGVGFWGLRERCQPISGQANETAAPDWILRGSTEPQKNDIGTTLTILAFDELPDWEETLATSVAENFFGSIAAGALEVDINGKHFLSKESIQNFFNNEALLPLISTHKNEPDHFIDCKNYLNCLLDDQGVIVEQTQSSVLGLCQLKILLGEGLPKKVAFLRNGMFISDTLSLPGIKSFSDFKEFVAVFECLNAKGIELLRGMEPPRHDDFEPDRLSTQELQKRGRKALKDMASWIRDMLKRHAKDPVSDVTPLDELKDYFPDDSGDGSGREADEINPFGSIIIRARPVQVKPGHNESNIPDAPSVGIDTADGEGGGGSEGAGGGSTESGGRGNAQGGEGASVTKPGIALGNVRALSVDSNSRKIFFTPTESGEISIAIYEAGADSDYELPITDTSTGTLNNGRVNIKATKGKRFEMRVKFDTAFNGALKVVAHEI